MTLKIALFLGGPSEERGISLNSARSVADHLEGDGIELTKIIYFDGTTTPYLISRPLLYSNTPSDFDFKLSLTAAPLTSNELTVALRACDLAFPVIHGAFGEDGEVQSLLEAAGVPYVGSASKQAAIAFDKYNAHKTLLYAGIRAIPTELLRNTDSEAVRSVAVRWGFEQTNCVVIKPARGGSSIDVHVRRDEHAALECLDAVLERHDRVLVQPRIEGAEFTTIVVDCGEGPIALVPVEVEVKHRHDDDIVFDYRRKYLATNESAYHCPPRFEMAEIERIRNTAETAFTALGARDFMRIDGWLQPDGQIVIADTNPISGMEQNSFLFIQAAYVGTTHREVLRLIVQSACVRNGVPFPDVQTSPTQASTPVGVIFGGNTAERQVSVLSGTNVWLKLLRSDRYRPIPFLLNGDGTLWRLTYATALRHTVEEIAAACHEAVLQDTTTSTLVQSIRDRLGLTQEREQSLPELTSMNAFMEEFDLAFLALHGGTGEDGTLQQILDDHNVRYNGAGAAASRLCMDKYETGQRLADLESQGIRIAYRLAVDIRVSEPVDELWHRITKACETDYVIVKPLLDGCSAGVVPLTGSEELALYLKHVSQALPRIEGGLFRSLAEDQTVEMPTTPPTHLLFEAFIRTDSIVVIDADADADRPASLLWGDQSDTGWVEATVGVVGPLGAMQALSPSVTVARQGVLSMEEKFMGGTGINLTPPPVSPLGRVEPEAIQQVKKRVAVVANRLGLSGYARIDVFMHCLTGEIIVIEANSLPALSPSTVLFHQALAEEAPIYPREFLEYLLDVITIDAPLRLIQGKI